MSPVSRTRRFMFLLLILEAQYPSALERKATHLDRLALLLYYNSESDRLLRFHTVGRIFYVALFAQPCLCACNPTFPFIPIIAFIGHRLRTPLLLLCWHLCCFYSGSYLANFSRAGNAAWHRHEHPIIDSPGFIASLKAGRAFDGRHATLLSLTYIISPALAGISFEVIAFSAPYWLGVCFLFCFNRCTFGVTRRATA